MDKIEYGARRSGRTTRMALDVVNTLITTDKNVIIVVHEVPFRWYVDDIIVKALRAAGATSDQIQLMRQRIRYIGIDYTRHYPETERESVFIDHFALECWRGR